MQEGGWAAPILGIVLSPQSKKAFGSNPGQSLQVVLMGLFADFSSWELEISSENGNGWMDIGWLAIKYKHWTQGATFICYISSVYVIQLC